jgi:hypothetical protein
MAGETDEGRARAFCCLLHKEAAASVEFINKASMCVYFIRNWHRHQQVSPRQSCHHDTATLVMPPFLNGGIAKAAVQMDYPGDKGED